MSVGRPLLLPLLLAAASVVRGGSAAYCDENLFPEVDEAQQLYAGVRFTKELSTTEYGPLNSFKTLHCCGERYLSLEWFKDSRPYPWPSDVSSFILNPESANQTIYTRSLTSSDHGVYTCQLANQTNIVNHSMKLVTFDVKSYWEDPLPTYEMANIHYALPGEFVRLYCEGFVGKVGLPDAVNTITWTKIGEKQTIVSNEKYRIEEVIRENDQILGAFLFINTIQETDYGKYMCSISNTDDQIVQQFTNITKPVLNYEQSVKKVQRDLKFIIFVMIALILIIWKRRWFYLTYQKMNKKLESDKYALSEKTIHNVIVFYDEANKENAQYLVENMEHRDNYITKKCHIDFYEDLIKTQTDLVKCFDFAIYLLSSDDKITSSLMKKSTQTSFVQDNVTPRKYLIDCTNMPVTPTKSWCDRVLADLSRDDHAKRNKNTSNKLMRVI
ncbi:uncharacterized protein LOC132939262 [Metopolophium dirhodum]|uniref:uncharacterized protein LOC132939262 n=1 Tax=Metopolophium dirhodum TaxID=44670 RepID=UPI0029905315|nr:uncharacterized protein LOC132939262 [Metopolophium dirhodum]